MSTITLQNFRVGSDLTVKVRLKDGGVAIDWSTLSGIRAVLYSDAQSSIAGRCDVTVDGEDPTLLVCRYAATKMQYLGVNRIVVSAKYMGVTKTYDKPAFTFVRWTEDQAGEEITIEDPEVTVEIDVEDVSSSILQEAVDAAFSAADRANEAAEAAEHMVDIHTGPAGKSAYEVAVEEGYTGTEEEWLASLKGPVGETPDISIGTVTTVEPGTPAAASMSGTPEAPVLNLSIPKGLVGATPNITVGTVTTGQPGTPVVVTITGTPEAPVLNVTIPQGMQGNTGSSVDYPYELVNNLTTNDATKGLSAAQGVVLDGKVSQLEAKVDGLDVNVGTWSVGSVNNPSGGHIPDYSSNRRMRTAELTIPLTATYFFKVNSGYKFGLIVVGKRETLIWDSTLSIALQQGDVYRIVLREDPDPTNTNIYSGWTQEQIDALIASSGFDMFVKSSFDELKEELEEEINAVAISAIKSEQYCEIDVPIWPRPNSYIQDGLIFFLDGKDFTSGNWVDKVGNSSFAMNNCVKDGDGVKFNGSTSYGTTEDNLSFPSQAYTIEMVVKGEKEVSVSSDSQIIFNTKNSGDFSLGFGMVGSAKLYTFQAGTTSLNLGYNYSSAVGFKRISVNKNKCVVNGEPITAGSGVANWSVGAKVVVGSNATNTNWFFKGTIYAIRIYNRLLSESEMKANQMFDLDYYNL